MYTCVNCGWIRALRGGVCTRAEHDLCVVALDGYPVPVHVCNYRSCSCENRRNWWNDALRERVPHIRSFKSLSNSFSHFSYLREQNIFSFRQSSVQFARNDSGISFSFRLLRRAPLFFSSPPLFTDDRLRSSLGWPSWFKGVCESKGVTDKRWNCQLTGRSSSFSNYYCLWIELRTVRRFNFGVTIRWN